jgi:hypothetical protein
VAVEHGFWEAAGDGSYYAEHMADDGLCLLTPGILRKEETIAAIEQGEPWAGHALSDVVLVEHGEHCATLCYVARARRSGAAEYEAAVSSTYDRRNGRWLLTVHQQTPLQP